MVPAQNPNSNVTVSLAPAGLASHGLLISEPHNSSPHPLGIHTQTQYKGETFTTNSAMHRASVDNVWITDSCAYPFFSESYCFDTAQVGAWEVLNVRVRATDLLLTMSPRIGRVPKAASQLLWPLLPSCRTIGYIEPCV